MATEGTPSTDVGIAQVYEWEALLYTFHTYPGAPILLFGFLCSFALSFAVGANDSANSWGTSVGAGTVSLGWAYLLGSIMETVGSTLLSGNVIKKLVAGIINITAYQSNRTEEMLKFEQGQRYLINENMLLIGCLSVMLGSALWQLLASFLAWPVSGSHSIVSGLLGFTLVAKGQEGVGKLWELAKIAIGWVSSPVISLIITGLLYYPLYRWCIRSPTPYSISNRIVYSILVWLAVGFNLLNLFVTGDIFLDASGWDHSWSGGKAYWTGIAFGVGLVLAVVFLFAAIPQLIHMKSDFALTCGLLKRRCRKKRASENEEEADDDRTDEQDDPVKVYKEPAVRGDSIQMDMIGEIEVRPRDDVDEEETGDDTPEVMRIFRPLQVLSACTGALAHGGNDVGNCVGPLVLIYHVFEDGIVQKDKVEAPVLISLYGGFGISMGLIMFGKRVIRTMGTDIARMTPSRGFCVEWMAAVTVLVCGISKEFAIPVSTTHCQVGALIGAGLGRGLVEKGLTRQALSFVNFRLLAGIGASWVATIPFSMGLTAAIYWILQKILIG